jgi:hypothetical protein
MPGDLLRSTRRTGPSSGKHRRDASTLVRFWNRRLKVTRDNTRKPLSQARGSLAQKGSVLMFVDVPPTQEQQERVRAAREAGLTILLIDRSMCFSDVINQEQIR